VSADTKILSITPRAAGVNVTASVDEIVRDIREQIAVLLTR
jgi:hypothetical protein